MEFFDIAFWQNLVSNSTATLIGVILGIPTALFINRQITKVEETKVAEYKRTEQVLRKKQLLSIIRESLEENLALLEQMESELAPNYVIFYNVDTELLESTSSVKYEFIDNLRFNRLIDSIRYELLHLHRKVELQLEIEYGGYRAIRGYFEKRTPLVGAILSHIPLIKTQISEALENISQMTVDQ